MVSSKQLLVFSAITDILTIFADSEIGGQYEFDYDVITNYINSIKMSVDYFDDTTKEEIYNHFTQDIYNGYPVWRMLKLTPWTQEMVEDTFRQECELLYKEECKKYKCLTCRYYQVRTTEFGIIDKCIYEENHKEVTSKLTGRERHPQLPKYREGPFELKEQCDKYDCK